MSLLARFTLAQKFLLVAGLGLLLALPPTLLWTHSQWRALQVAQQEAAGTAPTRATLRLVQLTQQHRGLSAAMLSGDAQAKTLRETKAREVQAALEQALQASAGYADPPAQQRREAVRDQWAALQADVAAARVQPAQSFARHGALVQAELAWVNDVVNLSGMALDPEPDSYHLIMVATAQLPMVTELMGQMRARGAAAIARGESSPEDAAMLGYTLRHLAQVRAGAALAMERVDLEAADARDVKQHWGQARAALEPVLALVNDRLLPGRLDGLTRQAWWDASTGAIDAQFALLDAALTHLEAELAQRAAANRQAVVLQALAVLLGLGLASWAIGLTMRETQRTAQDTLQCLQALAQGDFTQAPQAQGRDEFARMAQALQQATTSLGSLVRELKANGESVGTAAQQIASGNADLSQRTELTASNLQQTAAAMHQINATLDASASHARQATELAASASAVAGRGGEAMGQVVSTMQDISTSARRIADIIGVIDGIAFQTNILALNAAVEAARAGEQGRGFAVVASEVRNLAQRSASAAREIKQLINDSLQRVHTGAEQVGGAGHTIQEIVAQVRSVAALIDQMSNATAQQSQGVAEVNQAVSQLDQATQQNAALVEESAAAAASLGQQAQVLLAAMQRFRVPG